MTLTGVIAVDLVGLVLLLWILNLVRLGRLYVGYGAFFVALVLAGGTAASLPPLRRALTVGVRSVFPDGGAVILGFALVLFLLIYILTQTTIISNRLSAVVQDLAIARARTQTDERDAAETREGRG